MRIVHVVQGLAIGGQERLVVAMSRELARRGHEPVIVSLCRGGAVRAQACGVPIVDAVRADGADASLVVRLASVLRALRADAVHTHNPAPLLHAMPAAIVAGVRRRVHTKHGVNVYGPGALWSARAVVRAVHAVVAVSAETAEVARAKERVPPRVLHVVPNGIPLAAFHPDTAARARIRAELQIPPEAFVVGSVGRLAREKDYPLLVRAAAPMLGEGVRLVLVGDGASRGEVERAIDRALAPFVTLTGARCDVADLLCAFDVFALSSRTEGFPLAVPEAMAAALPIVATRVGGVPSAVPVECGVLVDSGDETALSRALSALAADRDRARSLGACARRHALAFFSIERTTDAYEALYRGA